VTAEGRDWALQQTSPKKALEQLVATLQQLSATGATDGGEGLSVLQAQLGELQESLTRVSRLTQEATARHRQDAERLAEAVREAIGVARRVAAGEMGQAPPNPQQPVPNGLDSDLVSFVRSWQHQRGTGCPLPDLYSHVRGRHPALTIGGFHDRLRALHASHVMRLSGMSGSLDDLRDPETALLVSSKVMYYANVIDSPS
jgi:hypothetical protein